MDITNEQAEYLLSLPKKVLKDKLLDKIIITQKYPLIKRFELLSSEDTDYSFLWEIKQSIRMAIRINLHLQENDSKIGLVRVDFNSGHKNPETINEYVPERFYPYAGKYLSADGGHIHHYVQGYKPLVWAVPLLSNDIVTKEITSNNFTTVITEFAKMTNIKTEIIINTLLL